MTLLLALLGCGNNCAPEAPLDYSEGAHWLCYNGSGDACPSQVPTYTVNPDGSGTAGTIEAASNPDVACFVVYPTLALGLSARIQDDTSNREAPENFTRRHAAMFADSCSVYAPFYRQATLGNFTGKITERKEQCLDAAYDDVEAAFRAFLVAEPTRDFVLLGHSQGGIHFETLIDRVIEEDPAIAARMRAAYPIGTGLTNASFDSTPTCTSATQRGCVVGLRSFLEGEGRPSVGPFLVGDEGVCVNPASPDAPNTPATLKAFSIYAGHNLVEGNFDVDDTTLLVWEDGFEAVCDGEGKGIGLQVRWIRDDAPPVDLTAGLVANTNGSHQLDLNYTEYDLRADIQRRAPSP